MKSLKRLTVPVLVILAIGMGLGIKVESVVTSSDTYRHLEKLQDAFMIIHSNYVDEVDASNAAEFAIRGILEELDPHSIYISPDEIKEVQESIQGSFGGVGIWFEVVEDTARVVSTVPDGPSETAGLMAGDRIISVDDSNAVGFNDRQIQKHLKGPVGTNVEVTVHRPGIVQPLTFQVTRGNISIHTVDSDYMLDEQTGYIRLSRFAVSSYDEFIEAAARLKQQGMQRLVLDMRDNPGGVMETAVRIVDEILDGGRTIVYTESRSGRFDVRHTSTEGGLLTTEPIIALVSPYSASASEIVAGALQDHDRGLIVGQRTFGKGLVQQQFSLPDGSVLQMTVSRYYTPSGRLIQTPYNGGNETDYYEQKFSELDEATFEPAKYLNSLPDSLRFSTVHGRSVFGGGGILPDVIVPPDTASTFWPVVRRGLDMLFIRDWFTAREVDLRSEWASQPEEFLNSFEVDDQMWQAFIAYVDEKQQETIGESEDAVPEEDVIALTSLTGNRSDLEILLKARLARQIYGARSSYPIYNRLDPTIKQAMQLWSQAVSLAAYHR